MVYIYIYIYIHNGILLSHKKNEIIPSAATWMDLEIIILREVIQKEKDKYYIGKPTRSYCIDRELYSVSWDKT